MIEFTIKTLDSNNHHFSVDDEITVMGLKEKVREQMGIEINLQRLIFCGRVLQDEKKLAEYDVSGKVVHLVQRAPPSPESRHIAHSNNSVNNAETSNATQQQIRRLMALASPPGFVLEEQQAMSLSPTAARLEFIRHLSTEIKSSLVVLRAHIAGEPEPQLDENGEEATDPLTRAQNQRRRSYRAMGALRARHTRPRDFGQLIEELNQLQEQFTPFRNSYIRMLRDANNLEPPQYSEEERAINQRTVDIVSDIMHSFAHAYHTVSDIKFHVGQINPRLTSETAVMRHPIPMQAHINVVPSNRRQQSQQGNDAAASNSSNSNATATSTTSSTTSSNAASTSVAQNAQTQTTQGTQPPTQTGRNTTQPTVNINIQPDPITYQVEIETRVPIAFALENALLNGLTNTAAANNQQPDQQNQQNQAQNQSQSQSQNQDGQQGQANRRQVLFDFENLFRGLGQAGGLGGVEVVMSMEEIPQGISGNVASSNATVNTSGTGVDDVGQSNEGGVYIAPMPWGGPPSADLLQNIVSSVIRQGLVPGMEGINVTTLNQAQSQQQNGQGNQSSQEGNSSGQQRQPNLHLRRASTTTRAQAVSLANLIYDRYLQCDSPHARRRLQRRRELHYQRVAAQERLRAERTAAQNIETLRDRNVNLSEEHMETLVLLLHTQPSQEPWFNALMVTVARYFYLSELLHSVAGEPALVPNEFRLLRMLLRTYIQNLLNRSGCADAENAFVAVADFLVSENADFIHRMETMATLRSDVNIYESIRTLIRRRLPPIITSVLSDSTVETFPARFYAIFARLFVDLCSLVYYCCQEDIDGLRTIYTAYVEEIIEDFEESSREMLEILCMDNLNHMINNQAWNVNNIQQYIQRTTEALSTSTSNGQPTPMEMSPAPPPVKEEPMHTSPPATPCNIKFSEPETRSITPEASCITPETSNTLLEANDITPEVTNITVQVASMTPDTSSTTTEAASITPEPATVTSETSIICETTSTMPDVTNIKPEASSVLVEPVCTVTNAAKQANTSTSVQKTSTIAEPKEAPANNIPQLSPSRSSIRTTTSDKSEKTETATYVPPIVVVQHWGEEWVPVFTRDQQTQLQARAAPPEPHSDAYLSGMPSPKRRCLRESRPPHTLDGLMNDSVREVTDHTSTVTNSTVRAAFREYMRNLARTRSAESQDYDSSQFASGSRFLNMPRSNSQEHLEHNREPKDNV